MTTTEKDAQLRENILAALGAFARQRSGMEFANYGDVKAFRSEQRSITKDLHQARALLAAVGWRTSITAEKLLAASRGAFSGRLTIERGTFAGKKFTPDENGTAVRIDYCTGQYFPTEYRRAVCAVLAAALWDYFRDNMPPPDGTGSRKISTGEQQAIHTYRGMSAGDYLRQTARKELGRSIASRWFN